MRVRRNRLTATALAATLAVVAATIGVSADASNHRTIPAGDWEGVISFFGDTGTARGDFDGSFRLQVAAGAATGDFGWEGIVATDAVGDVNVAIAGEISGGADAPDFTITSAISGGAAVPDASGGGNIVLTNVTCESIEGTGENITTAAQISDIEWFAIRAGSPLAAGTFFDDLRTLRNDTIRLVGLIGERTTLVLLVEINRLAADAEDLLAQLERTPECQAFHFRSLIASQVERLLAEVLADPRLADAVEFGDLVLLALRSGAWGPGAADVDAVDLEVAVIQEIERRVDEAIAADDGVALLSLGWLAVALGLTSTEERINAALGAR